VKKLKGTWLVRIFVGCVLGLLVGLILIPYYITDTRGPTLAICLLCTALGAAVGVSTLPFADDGKSLVLHSAAHFAVTAVLFLLLLVQFWSWENWEGLLLLESMLALLYVLIWLGRWIGWYVEVMQLRTLLGLDAGPSPLKWRETLPYLPFVLLLCGVLPVLLRWVERAVGGGVIDVPALSGLILPYVLLPVGGFCSGLSLGKRQGVCPLYPVALFLCYLPIVYLLFNSTALFHCFMVAVPALAGNILGWLYRRAVPKKGGQEA